VLRVIGTTVLVVGIFWFIPFHEVVAQLRQAKLGYVVGSFVLTQFIAYLESVQLWLLLRKAGMSTTTWVVFETKMITRFYGQFLPSELMASAVKLYRLAGPTNQWGEVMAALVLTRIVNMIALLLLGLVFWAIDMPSGPGRWIGVIMMGTVAALLLLHLVMSSRSVKRRAKGLLALPLFAWIEGRLVEKAKKLGATMADSYRLFGGMVWSITALSIVRHVVGIISFAMVAKALGVNITYMTIAWVRVVLQAIMMLPISLSGIGLREGSLVILLQEYSVPASQAVALAFLMFLISLLSNSLGGIFELKNVVRAGRTADPERSNAP
jgi:glycosyltransferase 2 family protein